MIVVVQHGLEWVLARSKNIRMYIKYILLLNLLQLPKACIQLPST